MAKPLVIVESPAKAKTISKFLGNAFDVRASVGHVADLPSKGLQIDVDNGFKPTYELTVRGKDVVKDLQAAMKDASELYLATDEDREGEAISWHLLEYLKPKIPVKRMVFHEITKAAIDQAVANPRGIDYGLVDAAETRRLLDRLYGYEVSPVLWRRVNRGLSAGRVQSPSVRLIVERERERIAFVTAAVLGHRPADGHRSGVQRHTGRARRHEGGHRQGLHVRRHSRRRTSSSSPRGVRGRWPTSLDRRVVHGALRRGEAVPQRPEGAVHDQHPAAGGRPQAATRRRTGHAHRPGSVRAWLHHLHAYRQRRPQRRGARRRPRRGAAHVRRQLPVARAAPVQHQGEERAGGPRGHPPHHALAQPRPGVGRAERPGAVAVPAGLAAHPGLADGRRQRHHRQRAPRRRRSPRAAQPTRPTASSPPAAPRSPSPATARSTSRAPTRPRPTTRRKRCCRR